MQKIHNSVLNLRQCDIWHKPGKLSIFFCPDTLKYYDLKNIFPRPATLDMTHCCADNMPR